MPSPLKQEGEKMKSLEITCEENLRFRTRSATGAEVFMDTPAEYGGKGEMLSPTDMLAAAFGSCVLSIMVITAQRAGVDIKGTKVKVSKEMISSPRRISKITFDCNLPVGINADLRTKFEKAVNACPVHNSLHPEIEYEVTFH